MMRCEKINYRFYGRVRESEVSKGVRGMLRDGANDRTEEAREPDTPP